MTRQGDLFGEGERLVRLEAVDGMPASSVLVADGQAELVLGKVSFRLTRGRCIALAAALSWAAARLARGAA